MNPPNPIWITVDKDAPTGALQAFLRETRPYGVVLFARHLQEAVQVRELCQCIHESTAGFAPRIALDQEGGRVSRLSVLGHRFPGASDAGGDPERTERLAWEMGDVLRDLGFDVDFAPVADLGPAAEGTGLEGRVYAEDPEVVTLCCGAFLDGLGRAGIEGCLKHFPGLGGSLVDSHRRLPRIEGSAEERRPHLEPYMRLASRAPYVMLAHGSYGCLMDEAPSTLSPEAYALLAGTGFEGLSLTDDLCMGAVADLAPLHELVSSSLSAGAGLALWVSPQEAALRAVAALAEDGEFVAKGRELGYRLPEGERD